MPINDWYGTTHTGAFSLDWLNEVPQLSIQNTITNAGAQVDSMEPTDDLSDEWEQTPTLCGDCGAQMQIVRPGKWQCPDCE